MVGYIFYPALEPINPTRYRINSMTITTTNTTSNICIRDDIAQNDGTTTATTINITSNIIRVASIVI